MSVHNVACFKDSFIFEYFLAVLTFVLFFFLAYFQSNASEEYPHIHLISTFHVSKGLSGYLYLGNSLIVYVVYPVRFHFSSLHFSLFLHVSFVSQLVFIWILSGFTYLLYAFYPFGFLSLRHVFHLVGFLSLFSILYPFEFPFFLTFFFTFFTWNRCSPFKNIQE